MRLIAGGDRYDRIVSWGGVVTSTDGLLWSAISEPFTTRARVNALVAGPDRIIAASDSGLMSSTSDMDALTDWSVARVWDGNFSPQSMTYGAAQNGTNGRYMMCGQGKVLEPQGDYDALDELGLIFSNETGANDDWDLVYAHDSSDARFYSVKFFHDAPINPTVNTNTWVAVGSTEGRPIVVYSRDYGLTWDELDLPTFDGINFAYDVILSANNFWITTNGSVYYTPYLETPSWNATTITMPSLGYGTPDFRRISSNPAGHMVIAFSKGLACTTDGVGWSIFAPGGYQFRSVIWYDDKWVASAYSNLTRYTYWTSTDTINWTPRNNGVYGYDFAITY